MAKVVKRQHYQNRQDGFADDYLIEIRHKALKRRRADRTLPVRHPVTQEGNHDSSGQFLLLEELSEPGRLIPGVPLQQPTEGERSERIQMRELVTKVVQCAGELPL